jgi:hypothetical protein
MRRLCATVAVAALVGAVCAGTAGAADPLGIPIPDSTGPTVPWPQLLPPLPVPNDVQPGPVPRCADPTLACVDDTLRIMRSMQSQLGCDHRAVFDTTYLLLTEEYRRTVVADPHFFQDNRYLNWEDTLFANYYFNAFSHYAAGQPVPEAWKIAFDAAATGDADGAQDMLLGINAHVQRDMPYVIAQLGMRKPDGSSRKPDHDAVNEILRRGYETIVAQIAARYDSFVRLSNAPETPLDNIGGLEAVKEWREGVWRNAERLMNATTDAQRQQVSASIEQNAAAWARSILTFQNPPGHRAERDAYCRAHLPPAPRASGRSSTARPTPLTLAVTVRPRRAHAGRRTRFEFTATVGGVRARGVAIRFAGHRAATGRRGRAAIVAVLRRGRYAARASRPGLSPARTAVYSR